jgi:spore germination protein
MVIHVVQPGETIWSIAQRYGVSAERIAADNAVTPTTRLVVGQALLVRFPQTVYTVQPGDTLASIAERYGVSEITLLQYNPFLAGGALLAGEPIVIAFSEPKRRAVRLNGYAYPYIDMGLLERTLPNLTTLTIFGYGFTSDGALIGIDDQPLINLAYRYQTAPVMLLTSLTEDGTFSSERASRLFREPALHNTVLENVTATMHEKGYLGLDIDFEFIKPEDKEPFLRFLETYAARMHAEGFFISTDLAPKTSSEQEGLLYESHDYAAVGEISDFVLLMTYEWGYTYGPPMAVAPLNQVRRVVDYAVKEIPREKILMGIPNYGYDWILPYERSVTRATSIGNEYAVEIAARNNVAIQFDEAAASPFFQYARDGLQHIVWFEDVRSIQAKYNLMDEYGLLGAGYWNLMRPFTQNWNFANTRYTIQRIV